MAAGSPGGGPPVARGEPRVSPGSNVTSVGGKSPGNTTARCWSDGSGSRSVTASPAFCSNTSRFLTERRNHPVWPSPIFKRTIFRVDSSTNTAMPSVSLVTAPISARRGRSGSAGDGGGLKTSTTGAASTAGLGGRREAWNIGRSRVADSAVTGTAHKGLPPASGRDGVCGLVCAVAPPEAASARVSPKQTAVQ